MIDRTLVKGVSYQFNVSWVDGDGNAVDFTTGSRVGYYRLRKQGATAVSVTLNTDDATEFTWSAQASGRGTLTILSNKFSALDEGTYVVDSYWEDTADSPTTRHYTDDTAVWEILDPANGDFA